MEVLVGTSLFFAATTAVFIVFWAKARQDADDWRRMSQVGFEMAIEEMERDKAVKRPIPPSQASARVNVAVRGRFLA